MHPTAHVFEQGTLIILTGTVRDFTFLQIKPQANLDTLRHSFVFIEEEIQQSMQVNDSTHVGEVSEVSTRHLFPF